MELYLEQLYDLLSVDKQKSKKKSIVNIKEHGITEKRVTNAQEILERLAQGSMA